MAKVEESLASVKASDLEINMTLSCSDVTKKSSVSSSTSFLVSSNLAITTPIVIAPLPTPFEQYQPIQQQPLATSKCSLTLSPSTLIHTHVPIYQLNNINITHTPNSSHIVSNSKLDEDFIDNNLGFDRFEGVGTINPGNKVANNLSNRRECKSTSGESYIVELKEQSSFIAPATTNIEKCSAVASSVHLHKHNLIFPTNSNIYRLNGGKFGFNPISQGLLPTSSRNKSNRLNSLSQCINSFDASGSVRKVPKRLNGQHTHFMDKMKKIKYNDYNKNKRLFLAVSNNDSKTVNGILESNSYDVNCVDDKHRTCLHIACSRGYINLVRLLLDHGANPNIRDCVNNLPIHLAIISSHVQVVTILLEAGTDIQSLDLNGKTVLHLAGTRLRWLLSDENQKASPKLKFEAIMIMNMIKEYLRQKKTLPINDIDTLALQLENSFNFNEINNITKKLLDQFETLKISNSGMLSSQK